MLKSFRKLLGRKHPVDWVILVVLLALCGMAGHWLARSNVWVSLRAWIYQSMSTSATGSRHPQYTAVVLLDDQDYWSDHPTAGHEGSATDDLAGRVPTNRQYLARIVTQLAAAGAPVIALDFDLRAPLPPSSVDFPAYRSEDDAFFTALRQACADGHSIVLASELVAQDEGVVEVPSIYDAAGLSDASGLSAPCVRHGYIQLPRDIRRAPDLVPLQTGGEADPFAFAVVRSSRPAAYNKIARPHGNDFPYSEFISEAGFRDTSQGQVVFSGREILSMTAAELKQKLLIPGSTQQPNERVVVVGGGWHTLAMKEGPLVDTHPSPGGDMSGVLLHANYIEAASAEKLNVPFPDAAGEAIDAILVLLIACIGMLEIHAGWKWGAVVAVSVLVVVGSYLLMRTFGLFLDFFFPLIFLGLHAGFEHVREWRHAAQHASAHAAGKE